MLDLPCVVRFHSDRIALRAKPDLRNKIIEGQDTRKLRSVVKGILLLEQLGSGEGKKSLLATLNDPREISAAGLGRIRHISTKGKSTFAVLTEHLIPYGDLSSSRFSVAQVSKPFIVRSHRIENGISTHMEIAPLDHLEDFLQGKKVTFTEVTFHDPVVTYVVESGTLL
ncbi:hypothetical protein [Nibribacter koreensis]|uniref:Uncharacterized protein n=1 Tax=Nibribacter koreensis TaxID=1084519 RepID=A0ABP8G421_9BACT